ncbi:hypothetical protein LQL77_29795 [Rhodococcus cerastii]|nr:hypothetical protein [Rhodococcus cerastii]
MSLFAEWITGYLAAGVDGIVVTDRNSYTGIDSARKALAELHRHDPEMAPLVIFPGAEITARTGTRVLAIFDPERQSEIVRDVLASCGCTGTRALADGSTRKSVAGVASVIAALGGLCVAAHADRTGGVFDMETRELLALAEAKSVVAAEIVDDRHLGRAERLGWVPVLGSAAPASIGEGGPRALETRAPGTHLTLVKAETLDLAGLRDALADPAGSVRRTRRTYR